LDDEGARALLDTERAAATARLAALSAELAAIVATAADDNGDDEHDPEGATVAYERARVASLADRARADLTELEEAASRLAEGNYRVCTVCGGPVGCGRLAARPAARTCIACAASG